ncbi:sarcosine oxidase [Acanthamoeba castellanii str. Neff]|uniref:Sarcosine oxidase n=1 Tax=Acanthamoeba castellanii (strain ATCC 30010 / Neff) TaxID=1257118 RepID=L8GXC2_ACACF|nr:sarcosine oxidase [Acanthamoeba castellanii str. Neff]ELR17625.1 sarcosine oxidase [Acanthamoeba castellanii str. Neff]
MEVPRPAYGFEFGEPPKDIRSSYDVVVIGLGGLGAAALYWVARKQKAGEVSVLGLEQYDLFHHRGGSQDHSRIIRLAQSAPWYTKIAPHMYFALLPRVAWKTVEDEAGIELVHRTGGLVFGPKDNKDLDDYARAMAVNEVPFDDLTAEEAMKRWPQLTLTPNYRVLYQADAGIVNPRLANSTHITLARKRGAHVLDQTKVTEIIPIGKEGAKVVTSKGEFTCKRLIICAGPWTNHCLKPFGLEVPIKTTKEQITYWATPNLREFSPSRFPVWISVEEKDCYYGFPVYGEVGTKAGVHIGGKEVDPDTRGFEPDVDLLNNIEAYMAKTMPGARSMLPSTLPGTPILTDTFLTFNCNPVGPRLYTKTCLYANTLDDDLIVDTLPNFPQVSLTVGCTCKEAFLV